jgi:hypothetical protein
MHQRILLVLTTLTVLTHAGLAPTLKTPAVIASSKSLDPDAVVRFTKNLYKELGSDWDNTTSVTEKYRDKFNQLNATTHGELGDTIASLLEIRMLDLQASIRRARKMRGVLGSFVEKSNQLKRANGLKKAVIKNDSLPAVA